MLHFKTLLRTYPKTSWSKVSISQDVNEKLFVNPIEKLETLLVQPLWKPHEVNFCANEKVLNRAQKTFTPQKNHAIKFLASAYNPKQFPTHDVPEVVFLGRSNVGKSSLIKAMFKNTPDVLVKTSKKPGHTKAINFFSVGKSFCLVDIPGYGQNQPKSFETLVEVYLKNRSNLMRTFFLMECDNLWTDVDNIALDMLREFKIPYVLVLTKTDTCQESIQLRSLMQVLQFRKKYMSNMCFPQPFLCSAATLEGIGMLQAFICVVTGAISLENE